MLESIVFWSYSSVDDSGNFAHSQIIGPFSSFAFISMFALFTLTFTRPTYYYWDLKVCDAISHFILKFSYNSTWNHFKATFWNIHYNNKPFQAFFVVVDESDHSQTNIKWNFICQFRSIIYYVYGYAGGFWGALSLHLFFPPFSIVIGRWIKASSLYAA